MSSAITIRGWSQGTLGDFTLDQTPVSTVDDPGGGTEIQAKDVWLWNNTGASGKIEAQLSASIPSEFTGNDDPVSLVDIESGFCSHVSDGQIVALAKSGATTKGTRVNVSSYAGQATQEFSRFDPGSLAEHITDGIAAALVGKDFNTDWKMFSSTDGSGLVFIINPSFWWNGFVDWTGVSIYDSQLSFKRGTHLISPDVIMGVAHYTIPVGAKRYWLDAANNLYERTITAVEFSGTPSNKWDNFVARLDSPLPAAVKPIKLFSVQQLQDFMVSIESHGGVGIGVLVSHLQTQQDRLGMVWETYKSFENPDANRPDRYTINHRLSTLHPDWTKNLRSGDSGSARYYPINGELVCVGMEPSVGLGFSPIFLSDITDAITALGGQQYTLPDLSGFNFYG